MCQLQQFDKGIWFIDTKLIGVVWTYKAVASTALTQIPTGGSEVSLIDDAIGVSHPLLRFLQAKVLFSGWHLQICLGGRTNLFVLDSTVTQIRVRTRMFLNRDKRSNMQLIVEGEEMRKFT